MKIKSYSLLGQFLLSFTLIICLFSGCQPDLEDPGGGNPIINPGIDNQMVTGGIRGVVIDENNQPVTGVTVTSGTNSTITDRYGAFRFSNISMSKANATVKIIRQGYYTAYRTFSATAGRIHNLRIKLIPKSITGTFAGSAGGTVNLPGGGKLVMPAAALTDASGNSYTGTVNVAMTWIDPSAANLPEIVMGDLRGLTTTGEERGLSTYGMIGVELSGTGGQSLKIAANQKAELTFPIPASLQSGAPVTIDLWHFDEATARWKQEGTATKSGNNYVAEVTHFSFWNCDAPFPLINLCMSLVNSGNNQPLINVQVRIKRSNNTYGSGYTDSTGNLCGKVPKDEALVLQVMDQCYNVVYSQNIGPFGADASLGTISVNVPPTNTLVITGVLLNCSNANVTNGSVVVFTGGPHHYSVPVTNGTFSLTLLRCNNSSLNFSLVGIDHATSQQGTPVSGTGTTGTVNVGNVQACGVSTIEFLEFIVDGIPFAYVEPPDFVNASDTLGNTGPLTIIGRKVIMNVLHVTQFGSSNNVTSTGPAPLIHATIDNTAGMVLNLILTPNPVINITTLGPSGTGFIEGNFNVQMSTGAGPARNVLCSFKVRRP